MPSPDHLLGARLPRWLLPAQWPEQAGQPVLADLNLSQGRVRGIAPHDPARAPAGAWHLDGALVLPGLVDAHTHLDKTFTLSRMGTVKPGLLGAIEAMMADRPHWTEADIRTRAGRALQWAHEAGTVHLRTHCDWWEPDAQPLAWNVLRELAQEWAPRLTLERVALIPLHLYSERDDAMRLARTMAASGPGALLGGFVHTSNWNPQALRHLFEAAQRHGLDVDLHVDEELTPQAQGLATTAALLRELRFDGHVVCGHTCALAVQDEAQALATLDAVAASGITLVTLPITNLLLQDATTGRTPRQRGLTLVKEARARGIPVLIASDNVQDPFCPVGSFDPLEALNTGVLAAQLEQPFDLWSEALCRADWLRRGAPALPLQPGSSADLIIFPQADCWGFPSRTQARVVLRQGAVASGQASATWSRSSIPTRSFA
ncbi:amidohydrolase family protein [Comamonas endophytica]|uniref:Amidohydrolase family protein n=1 Tax=Comamonas endophytica TaxID=2949090 RepID=A0ABY6GDD8_9BURK|nr:MULTISPECIES: amidohydrolase family protein [unclassified Acidovorax]MCD2513678.1 amidohydrolase family protein [Acidovorax sp. D4N7]UYG52315.1 amidohydrolase family protein [Acidovorax sp. 5MLIR]